MPALNRSLPFGEVSGVGIRLYSQNDYLFDHEGRQVRLEWDDVDGERYYRAEPVGEAPPAASVIAPERHTGNRPANLSFKGYVHKPGDPVPSAEREWTEMGDDMLRRSVELFGEKWTDREAAIYFLKNEGKSPSDLDA